MVTSHPYENSVFGCRFPFFRFYQSCLLDRSSSFASAAPTYRSQWAQLDLNCERRSSLQLLVGIFAMLQGCDVAPHAGGSWTRCAKSQTQEVVGWPWTWCHIANVEWSWEHMPQRLPKMMPERMSEDMSEPWQTGMTHRV